MWNHHLPVERRGLVARCAPCSAFFAWSGSDPELCDQRNEKPSSPLPPSEAPVQYMSMRRSRDQRSIRWSVLLTVVGSSGSLRSTRLPPTGPAAAQFPTASQTLGLSVEAFAVSTPAPTLVASDRFVWLESASPEPPSLAAQETVTLPACQIPSAVAQFTTGDFLSTLLPAIGSALAQFVATSQTWRPSVEAFPSSMLAGTAVVRSNEASEGFARPDSLSLAVQLTVASALCQIPSGVAQTTSGGVTSGSATPPLAGSTTMKPSKTTNDMTSRNETSPL